MKISGSKVTFEKSPLLQYPLIKYEIHDQSILFELTVRHHQEF